jgi:hypothetical protein
MALCRWDSTLEHGPRGQREHDFEPSLSFAGRLLHLKFTPSPAMGNEMRSRMRHTAAPSLFAK